MKKRIRLLACSLVLALLAVGVRQWETTGHLNPDRLHESIQRIGAWGPVLYILVYTIGPALLIPAFPFTLAGGLAFGPLWGTVYASIASTLSAAFAFLISRYFARDAVQEFLGERWRRIDRGVAERGWIYIALTRLMPVIPFNLLNYAFGLTQIRFSTYLWASWLFMLPETAALVLFGSSVLHLIKGRVSPAFLLGLLLILGGVLIPFLYKKWKGSKGALPVTVGLVAVMLSLSLA